MFEVKIYNFCPIDVEVVQLMQELRKINKKNGYRLVRFEEQKEIQRRGMPAGIKSDRRFKECRKCKSTRCEESKITSILTYNYIEPA